VPYFSTVRPLWRADAALRRGQEELEGRVEERTRELANASRQLARSVEGLERSNREVTLLGEMVDLFQACRTTQEANDVIARCASRLFSGVSGALYVFRASRNLVERAASAVGDSPGTAPSSHAEPPAIWSRRDPVRWKDRVGAGPASRPEAGREYVVLRMDAPVLRN